MGTGFSRDAPARDTGTRGGIKAAAIIAQGQLDRLRADRYAGWQGDLGAAIRAECAMLASVADYAVKHDLAPQPRSGRQETCEILITLG